MVQTKIDEDLELAEFAVSPCWDVYLREMERARVDLVNRAARSDLAVFQESKGKLLGFEIALNFLKEIRSRTRLTSVAN